MAQKIQPPIRIIALALHVTIMIYVFIVFFYASHGQWQMGWRIWPGNEVILAVLAFMAVPAVVMSLFLPRIAKGIAPGSSVPHEMNQAPLFFDFSDITGKLLTLTLVRMILAESVAIFGFVAAFVNQAAYWILPFAAVGLLLQILVGPFGRYLKGP